MSKKLMKVTACVGFKFCAAHRLQAARFGNCCNIHGHNYEAILTISAGQMKDGVIIDFRDAKDRVGLHVAHLWDHAYLYEKGDPVSEAIRAAFVHTDPPNPGKWFAFDFPPTAENLAAYLLHKVCPAVFDEFDAVCTRVQVIETPTCWAVAEVVDADKPVPLTFSGTEWIGDP